MANTELRTLVLNTIDFLTFGFNLYRRGVCDERIKSEYRLTENSEKHGYSKEEAAKMTGLSVRQFDRRVQQGKIARGRKVRGFTTLFWDKDYIDKMSIR